MVRHIKGNVNVRVAIERKDPHQDSHGTDVLSKFSLKIYVTKYCNEKNQVFSINQCYHTLRFNSGSSASQGMLICK